MRPLRSGMATSRHARSTIRFHAEARRRGLWLPERVRALDRRIEYDLRRGAAPFWRILRGAATTVVPERQAAFLAGEEGDVSVVGYGSQAGLEPFRLFAMQELGNLRVLNPAEAASFVPNADLVVYAHAPSRSAIARVPPLFVLPIRVSQFLDTTRPVEAVLRELPRRNAHRFRKRVREGSRLERADDVESFDLFYERFHRPQIEKRFGPYGTSEPKDIAWHAIARRGVLLFVREHDERVAGALCLLEPRRGVVRPRLNGVLDGRQDIWASGVLSHLNLLLADWAHENGYSELDLSGGAPFLSRGIYQSKRRLHPEVRIPQGPLQDYSLTLEIRRDTPALRDFLVSHPFACREQPDSKQLIGHYFYDDQRPLRSDLRPGAIPHVEHHLDEILAECRAHQVLP